jgi:DegV family protein with EDD domain
VPEIAIFTDSIACLNREQVEQYGIEIIPITVLSGGHVYRDWIDITPTQAYEIFQKDPESFKTAPPTPEQVFDAFQKASQTATNVICITVSTKISTLYNIVRVARERAKETLPGIKIEIIDSRTAAAAEGFVVLAAASAAEAGKSVQEVLEAAESVKRKVQAIVLLDTVRYVYRSGRVPKIAAQAASVLNIRPIFSVSESIHYLTAVVSKSQGITRMIKMMHSMVDNLPVHCAIIHAYALNDGQMIKERVAREFNCVELWISEFSPVMGYATGTGTLGLAFYTD